LATWHDRRFEVVVSAKLLDELSRVLRREKFRRYVSLEEVDGYLQLLRADGTRAADPSFEPGLTPDPNDDYLVALAREAEADVLVSGDSDLTELPDPRPPVLTPRRFLERIKGVE
jgi:putative PIN family toxin of toxin-antitoxin system